MKVNRIKELRNAINENEIMINSMGEFIIGDSWYSWDEISNCFGDGKKSKKIKHRMAYELIKLKNEIEYMLEDLGL